MESLDIFNRRDYNEELHEELCQLACEAYNEHPRDRSR